MVSSDKRPSIKGKKKTQAPQAREEGAPIVVPPVAGADAPADASEQGADSAAACVSPVQAEVVAQGDRSSSFKVLVSRTAQADAEADAAASACGSASVTPPAVSVAIRRSEPAPAAPEQPSDFFDLGDFGEGGQGVRRKASHRPALALGKRKTERDLDAAAPVEHPADAADAVAPSNASHSDREEAVRGACVQSTSRKATEREKAIVRGRKRRVALAAVVSACIIAIAVSGLLFWNAYLRYDDAADIQGEWQVADGSMTVVIDGDSIDMPESLSYAYQLDTWKKTIGFSFEDLSGGGSYRFSSDRKGLVIREGEDKDALTLTLVKISDDASAQPRKGDARVQEQAPDAAVPEDGGDSHEASDSAEGQEAPDDAA